MRSLLLLILCLISTLSLSAQMPVKVSRDNQVILEINGNITPTDGQQFINIAESWKNSGNPINLVFLNSGGGSVSAAYEIGYYITLNKISTIVMNNSLCASSCFNIFLTGQPRIAEPNSRIGVHRVSYNTNDTNLARSISIDLSNYYKSMNVPSNIRLAMLETAPKDIYFLTKADKKSISTYQLNYEEAHTIFTNSEVKLRKNSISQISKIKAKNLNKEAIPLIWKDQLTLAIAKLEEAKRLYPSNSEILGNLGFAYQRNGDLNNAQINFTASLKLTPKRGATWGNLADLLADIGQIDWATDAYINYYTYSKNKQAALHLFYEWLNKYQNTGRSIAVRNAMFKLGLQ